MSQHLTSQQATAEIIALINRSPHSPRPDEVEAIVSRVASPTIAPSAEARSYIELYNAWACMREPHAALDSPEYRAHEVEFTRAHDIVEAAAKQIVRSGSDLVALAAVALSFYQLTEIDFAHPEPVADKPGPGGFEDWVGKALAVAVLRQAYAASGSPAATNFAMGKGVSVLFEPGGNPKLVRDI